jgi:Bacterial DNA-binding protein
LVSGGTVPLWKAERGRNDDRYNLVKALSIARIPARTSGGWAGFNPKTQQKIKIPAKTVVKFRVAKAAKDAVLGVKK